MRQAIFFLLIIMNIFTRCKSSDGVNAEKFGFALNKERLKKCLPIIEKDMEYDKLNDSVILYSFGQLDTTRNAYHFSKTILLRGNQIIEEEDEFFLPTTNSFSYFLTVKYNYIKDSTYTFIQQYFWNDAFRTKSQVINYLEAKQMLLKEGISFCK